jgi:hypothetical protein
MRGGQNKKSIEQHIEDGTYRPDRHGLLNEDDSIVLSKMKYALYRKFQNLDKILDKTEINSISRDNVNYYISIIKTFDSISKNPNQTKLKHENDKDEL